MHLPRHGRGWCPLSGGHRHDPSLSGWRATPRRRQRSLSRQVLDQQIARRRARLVALEAEMIAACEAAAMGAHPGIRCDCGTRALGSDDLAPLPRRSHAAGGDIRPAHTPSPPGNRPARTADDAADRRLIGSQTLCPPRSIRAVRAIGLAAIIDSVTGWFRRPLLAPHEGRRRGRNSSSGVAPPQERNREWLRPGMVRHAARDAAISAASDWGPRQQPAPSMPRAASRSRR